MKSAQAQTIGTKPSDEASMTEAGAVRYCAVCGQDSRIHGAPLQRFGETLCSEAHADTFVSAVQAERARAASLPGSSPQAADAQGAHCAMSASGGTGWKQWGLRALCWGGPLLAVVLLLGGGSTLLGTAGAALPYLALLACPVGMIIMMKSMGGMQQPPANRQHQIADINPQTEQTDSARRSDAKLGQDAS